MGLFDDILKGAGDLLGKGQCTLGFHKGEWNYTSKKKCDQEINCERCGKKTRVKHKEYTSWVDNPDYQCWQYRHCKRCSLKEERRNHNFSTERPKYDWSCEYFIKTCSKCGKEEEEKSMMKKHAWGSWKANPNARNEMFRVCNRCKEKEFSAIK